MMESFFVLIIGGVTQYKYAWFEATSRAQYTSGPVCRECSHPIGRLRWLEPYEVILKQTRSVGDFLTGAGGCDFIVKEKFLKICNEHELKGIEQIYPIVIKKIGSSNKSKPYDIPILFGLDIMHTSTLVDFSQMGVEWSNRPSPDYCRFCGPGGGGANGTWKKIDHVVIKQETWTGEDMFFAANFAGEILLSSKAAEIIRDNKLSNVAVVPCEEYLVSFCV